MGKEGGDVVEDFPIPPFPIAHRGGEAAPLPHLQLLEGNRAIAAAYISYLPLGLGDVMSILGITCDL